MQTMFLLMILLSFFLTFSSHPLAILIIILAQTLLICMTTWMLLKTSWFSFILFLIFLGGLMVLFVYVVSLASNEKFEFSITESILMVMLSSTMVIYCLNTTFFKKNSTNSLNNFNEMISLIFSKSISLTTILIMFYLLFTLIVAVKVASKFEGPLRNLIK